MEQLSRVVGDNLKRLRAERGLSLDALAKASAVSKSRLAQIERGEANPSIGTVWQIAHALKVEFTALVTSPQPHDSVIVSLSDVEPLTGDDGRCHTYPLFPFDASQPFEVYITTMEPGAYLHAEPHPDGTHEIITVVEGRLDLTVGDVRHELAAGDAIRFRADTAHEYENPGDGISMFNMIVAYPS